MVEVEEFNVCFLLLDLVDCYTQTAAPETAADPDPLVPIINGVAPVLCKSIAFNMNKQLGKVCVQKVLGQKTGSRCREELSICKNTICYN